MKVIILDWEFMPGYFLNKAKWEGKECIVMRILEKESSNGKRKYLLKEPYICIDAGKCRITSRK